MPRSSQTRLALASEKPDTCTGLPRLPSKQGAKQEAQMSPSRTNSLSLAEAVTLLAWGQRFTAEDFMAVDGLKVNVRGPRRGLEIYRRAISDGWRISKEMKKASGGHLYTSDRGRKAIDKQLDAAFSVIVKAIQDRRDTSARGWLDIGDVGGRPILWKWFTAKPEPTADWEMNVIQNESRMSPYLIDDDGEKCPNPTRWIDVKFDRGEIGRLCGENQRKGAQVRRGGRRKGSGSLAGKDEPLLKVMKPLIDAGASHWAAAMKVVGDAVGAGIDESKAKRLVARYREWEKSNSE